MTNVPAPADGGGWQGLRNTVFGDPELQDVQRMTERLFLFDGGLAKLAAFWVLILLAAVIASAGVVADSTATVIGAMIVAPLMTPILGTALAIVLVEHRALLLNLALVAAGGVAVVTVGFLIGLTTPFDVVAATNSQVAGRVSPRLVDLLAALATGLVGAYALIRSDVSDTVPGVAIAISLVPPLAVVGLTLESGAADQSVGALLLFGTNVTAILVTGMAVMLVAGIRKAAFGASAMNAMPSSRALLVLAAVLVVIAVPLSLGSAHLVREHALIAQADMVVQQWEERYDWRTVDIAYRQGKLVIVMLGRTPAIPAQIQEELDSSGFGNVPVEVLLVGGDDTIVQP